MAMTVVATAHRLAHDPDQAENQQRINPEENVDKENRMFRGSPNRTAQGGKSFKESNGEPDHKTRQASTEGEQPVPTFEELAPYRDDEACTEWAQAVEDKWPHLKRHDGFYYESGEPADHAWNKHPNGTIVDSTAQQFGNPEIVTPDMPQYANYISYTEQPAEAQALAHHRGEHYDGPEAFPTCPTCNPLTQHANELAKPHAERKTQDLRSSKLTQADIPEGEEAQTSGHAILPENLGGHDGRARSDQERVGAEHSEARQAGISDDQRDVGDNRAHRADRGKATTPRHADLADPAANGLIHPRDIQGNGTWLCPKGHQQPREPAIGYSSYCEGCKAFIPREHFIYYVGNPALDQVRQAAMTRSQLLAQRDRLLQEFPDRTEPVHQWDDGWSMRKPKSYGDIHRTGELMGNCLSLDQQYQNQGPFGPYDSHFSWPKNEKGYPEDQLSDETYQGVRANLEAPLPHDSSYRFLTDPDGVPHVSAWEYGGDLHEALGRHNADPKDEYIQRLTDYMRQSKPTWQYEAKTAAGVRLDNQVPIDPRLKNQPFLPQDQPPTHCRFCGHELDAHPGMPGASPNLKCNNTTCLAYGVWVHDNTNVPDSAAGMIQNKLRQAADQPRYIHTTDKEFAPGDILRPPSETGHESEWSHIPQYDPNSVYLWDQELMHNNPDGYYYQHTDDPTAGYRHYEVEPMGEVRPDPEAAEFLGTEDEAFYHPYWHTTPQARVIREVDPEELYQERLRLDRHRHTSARYAVSASPIDLAHGVHESSEQSLRLELLCGSDVDPQVNRKQEQVKALLAERGIEVRVQPTVQDGRPFQDAYVYFAPEQINDVIEALKQADIPGDVLDGAVTPEVEQIADQQGWSVESNQDQQSDQPSLPPTASLSYVRVRHRGDCTDIVWID
jgi:hypothetical protein